MIAQYAINYNSIIMVGDFNFTGMSWHSADACEDTLCESMFRNLITEHQLQQLITKPTRGNAILDLVFVSKSIIVDEISCLPPISTLDHDSQLLRCQLPGLPLRRSLRPCVDYESLCLAISNINWTQAFSQCRYSDDFATRFTNLLSKTIVSCTKYVPSYKGQRLPRHIVHLLRAKKKLGSEQNAQEASCFLKQLAVFHVPHYDTTGATERSASSTSTIAIYYSLI